MSENNENWNEDQHTDLLVKNDDDVILITDDGTEVNLSSPPLSPNDARELTEHIKAAADMFYVLVARAHAGKAWKALGYKNFEEYVRVEFDMSRSRAYQLLDQNKIIAAITEAAPEGTEFHITEAAARDLKDILEDVVPEVSKLTEGLSPEDAGNVIEELVRLEREKKNSVDFDEDDFFDDDEDGFSDSSMGKGLGNGKYDGERFGDVSDGSGDDDIDLDEMDDLVDFDEDPKEMRRNYDAIYVLYTVLNMMKDLPPVDGVIAMIPVARRVQVESSLAAPVAWLEEFSEKWQAQEWREAESEDSDEVPDEAPLGEFKADSDVEDIFSDLEADQ